MWACPPENALLFNVCAHPPQCARAFHSTHPPQHIPYKPHSTLPSSTPAPAPHSAHHTSMRGAHPLDVRALSGTHIPQGMPLAEGSVHVGLSPTGRSPHQCMCPPSTTPQRMLVVSGETPLPHSNARRRRLPFSCCAMDCHYYWLGDARGADKLVDTIYIYTYIDYHAHEFDW